MGLTLNDRKMIAKRWADGDSAVAIAESLGRSPGTIYAELTRGHTGELDLNSRPKYDLERGESSISGQPPETGEPGPSLQKTWDTERSERRMTNIERLTASLETLGAFLASIPTTSGPWDEVFRKEFCAGYGQEDCEPTCPHQVE